MENSNKSSYRSIFKATSLFGGVQLYKILIQVIKSKFIAILLGPAGYGVLGLLTSATDLVKQLTSMGLAQSAVRDVAEANGTGDTERVNRTVTVLRKIVWATGLLGLICVIIFSPFLSKTSFGNYDYTIPFILLSITLLIDQLNVGQLVVIQGMRKLKDLAKASAIGATLGLIVSVPLYYWLGVHGIVPTLILTSLTGLLLSWWFSRKIPIPPIKITLKESLKEGRTMLKMGIAMSVSAIMLSASMYVLKAFISHYGGTETVGYYTAGAAIITTYVGMIFQAISTDYYPRLAAVNTDNDKCKETVNQQGEIAALIMGAALTICVIFMPLIIWLLYSSSFMPASIYVVIASVGMMFKLASWLISYQFVAKGESKLFIVLEITANMYMLVLNLLGYKLWGLAGLGLSFTLGYLIYLFHVFILAKRKYNFNFTSSFIRIFIIQLVVLLVALSISLVLKGTTCYIVGGCLCIISLLWSFRELNERIELVSFLRGKAKN